MDRGHGSSTGRVVACAWLAALPVLGLAQGGPSAPGKLTQPSSGAEAADTTARATGGGPDWLWMVVALLVLAVALWTVVSQLRRDRTTA